MDIFFLLNIKPGLVIPMPRTLQWCSWVCALEKCYLKLSYKHEKTLQVSAHVDVLVLVSHCESKNSFYGMQVRHKRKKPFNEQWHINIVLTEIYFWSTCICQNVCYCLVCVYLPQPQFPSGDEIQLGEENVIHHYLWCYRLGWYNSRHNLKIRQHMLIELVFLDWTD